MKNIDYRFKILYAVGMVMVVCGHCQGGGLSFTVADWFPYGGLHLALFVFCSGYFYKSSSEEHAGKYLLKKLRTLILPMYVYTLVYGIIVQISRLKGFSIGEDFTWYNLLIAPITSGHQFAYNLGGWFIVPLFMVEIVNVFFRKLCRTLKFNIPEYIYFILAIVIGIAGNKLAVEGYNSGWWLVLVRFTYFIPFYCLGIIYKNKLETHISKIPSLPYLSAVMVLKLIIIYYYGKSVAYTPSWCNNFTEGPIIPVIVGFLGIAFWMRIATIAEPVIGKSRVVNLIANNTYSIMMNQFLGFMGIKTIFAAAAKFTAHFQDFNWVSYKSDLWWYYVPRGVPQMNILYLIAGIAVPIIIQFFINQIKKHMNLFMAGYKKT